MQAQDHECKSATPTELRANIYKLLEEVLETGIPLEINKGNKRLRIVPVEQTNKRSKHIGQLLSGKVVIGRQAGFPNPSCYEERPYTPPAPFPPSAAN